jgi:hypothetical protein
MRGVVLVARVARVRGMHAVLPVLGVVRMSRVHAVMRMAGVGVGRGRYGDGHCAKPCAGGCRQRVSDDSMLSAHAQ